MQGIFVGTFLIGLREGLEATLIVSIIGAFLTRNGKSVRPMFVGVGLGGRHQRRRRSGAGILSASLPQRQQEMLETVIGAIAVVFVTTMILWMNRNAFRMKGELERGRRAGDQRRRGPRAGRHGLPRGAQGGIRDRGIPARGRPGVPRQPLVRRRRRGGGHRRGGRHRRRPLLRQPQAQPRPVLPHHRSLPGVHRRGSGDEQPAHGARGRLDHDRSTAGPRPLVVDPDEIGCGRGRSRECSASPPILG